MARARGLLLLASLLAAPWARADLTVDPVPAWAGYARHGAVTEVGIRLLAARAGPVEVTLRGERSSVTTSVDLAPAVAQTVYLPVRLGNESRVQVEVHRPAAPAHRQEVEVRPLPSPGPVLAVVTPGDRPDPANLAEGGDAQAIEADPGSLPRHAQAYEWIDTLVLDEAALAAIDPRQRQALDGYLAGCGRLSLVGASPATLETLRTVAGCSGRHVGLAGQPAADPRGAAAEPVADDPRPLRLGPGVEALAAAEADRGRAAELAVYFAAYALVLALAAWLATRPVWLLATPLATAAVGVALWSQAGPTSRVVSWAEIDSDDPAARFAALVRVEGHGSGRHEVRLPAPFGLPLATPAQEPVTLRLAPERRHTVDLRIDAHLLSEHAFVVSGTFEGGPALALRLTTSGPEVVNPGQAPSPPAVLAWRGARHEVPVLAPSARWRPPPEGSAWPATPAEQALRARSLRESALLLVPYTLADAGLVALGSDARGWLLVRPSARGPST